MNDSGYIIYIYYEVNNQYEKYKHIELISVLYMYVPIGIHRCERVLSELFA